MTIFLLTVDREGINTCFDAFLPGYNKRFQLISREWGGRVNYDLSYPRYTARPIELSQDIQGVIRKSADVCQTKQLLHKKNALLYS